MTTSGKRFDYIGNALRRLFERNDVVPRFKLTYVSSSASTYFLSDYADAVLIISPTMLEDQYFKLRDDIEYKYVDDPRLYATFFLIASEDNIYGIEFINYVEDNLQKQ
jgi:hypothetical protein